MNGAAADAGRRKPSGARSLDRFNVDVCRDSWPAMDLLTFKRRERRAPIAITASMVIALALWLTGISSFAVAQPLQLSKLQPPHEEIGPSFWEQHGGQIVIAVVVFFALVALCIAWLQRPKPVVITPPVVLARGELEGLQERAENGALLVEVSRVVRRYVISTFMLPPEELTTAELLQALQTRSQIDGDLITTIGQFLRRSDERKFAPALAPPQIGVVTRAAELVETIENYRLQSLSDKPPQPPTGAAGNS